jgi:hypothetical protein
VKEVLFRGVITLKLSKKLDLSLEIFSISVWFRVFVLFFRFFFKIIYGFSKVFRFFFLGVLGQNGLKNRFLNKKKINSNFPTTIIIKNEI